MPMAPGAPMTMIAPAVVVAAPAPVTVPASVAAMAMDDPARDISDDRARHERAAAAGFGGAHLAQAKPHGHRPRHDQRQN